MKKSEILPRSTFVSEYIGQLASASPRGLASTIFFSFIVFLYLFNLELQGMGGLALSHLILLLALRLRFRYPVVVWYSYLRHGILVSLLFVPPLLWTAAYFYYYQSDAITLMLATIKTYIWSWCVALLMFDMYNRDDSFKRNLLKVLAAFVFALIAQSIFILLSFFYSPFSKFVNTLLVVKGNLTGLEDFRSKGLANSGGANMSMLLSFGVVTSVCLFYDLRQSKYFIFAIVMAVASALVGRSGLIFSTLFITLYCLICGFKTKLFIFLLLFLLVLLLAGNSIDVNSAWGKWFFLEAGDSVSELQSMIFSETDITSLLYGAGFFENPIGQHERSDSGFVRAIYALGLPLAIYFYSVVIFVFLSALKTVKAGVHVASMSFLYFAIIMTVFMLLAFEFKESMLYQNMTGRALFWIANSIVLLRLREKRRRNW